MNSHRERIGIEFISVFGLPPVEFVALAAELGCGHIGIALAPLPQLANPHHYPGWSLREDAALRRQTAVALREHEVTVSLGEGFIGMPGASMESAAPDLDVMAELGVECVNFLSVDADRGRAIEQCATFARLAAARALDATLEFLPGLSIGDLPSALDAVHQVGMRNFRLLLDAMHVFRSGATTAAIAALDPRVVGYVQLCDVPCVPRNPDYSDEARHRRLPPGQGELPLQELLRAVPRAVTIGLEVPMLDDAQAGIGPRERLVSAVQSTRQLLDNL